MGSPHGRATKISATPRFNECYSYGEHGVDLREPINRCNRLQLQLLVSAEALHKYIAEPGLLYPKESPKVLLTCRLFGTHNVISKDPPKNIFSKWPGLVGTPPLYPDTLQEATGSATPTSLIIANRRFEAILANRSSVLIFFAAANRFVQSAGPPKFAGVVALFSARAKGAAKASCGETVVQKGVFGESVSSLPP